MTRGFPKKSFSNKKKGPHPVQHFAKKFFFDTKNKSTPWHKHHCGGLFLPLRRHDSNSVFRRLIAAYFFKKKDRNMTHDPWL